MYTTRISTFSQRRSCNCLSCSARADLAFDTIRSELCAGRERRIVLEQIGRQSARSAIEQHRGLIRVEQRLHLPEQGLISPADVAQESGAAAGIAVERGVIDLLHAPPLFLVESGTLHARPLVLHSRQPVGRDVDSWQLCARRHGSQ